MPDTAPRAQPAGHDGPGAAVVTGGLLLFAAVWLASLAATALSPPLDNVEQLVWMRSLEGGYYKHPPLPTWLLWPVVQVVGWNAWATYGLGAACTLAALAIQWHLVAHLLGRRAGMVALLAALGITYYSGRLNYYNHNILLLLAVAAAAWCCWHALHGGGLRHWAGLGLALGVGAMSKYQVALVALPVLFALWQVRAWREAAHWRGAALGLVLMLACFAPHAVWLVRHDFAPMNYAIETSLGVQLGAAARTLLALKWLADQVFNRALPALILLGVVAWGLRRQDNLGSVPATVTPLPVGAASDTAGYLLAWGLLPLLSITFIGIATGAELQLQWGTSYLVWLVPALMVLAARWRGVDWRQARLRRAAITFGVLQALLLALNFATSPAGPQRLRQQHARSFDSPRLAALLAAPARAALGGPVRIVSGDPHRAGSLALQLPEQPLVLVEGRLDHSPWLTADMVRHCGVLKLFPAPALPGGQAVGDGFPGLAWAVVPRDTSRPCPLDRPAGP